MARSVLRIVGQVLHRRTEPDSRQDLRNALTVENVLSDWNVQQAIESLATGKAPGPDGWPAEFYQRMSPREKDEKGHEEPSRMARLIAQVLRECWAAGVMTPEMRTSVTSLIWKEKGKRCSLRYYRPITVTSVLYKILGKSIVCRYGPRHRRLLWSVRRQLISPGWFSRPPVHTQGTRCATESTASKTALSAVQSRIQVGMPGTGTTWGPLRMGVGRANLWRALDARPARMPF